MREGYLLLGPEESGEGYLLLGPEESGEGYLLLGPEESGEGYLLLGPEESGEGYLLLGPEESGEGYLLLGPEESGEGYMLLGPEESAPQMIGASSVCMLDVLMGLSFGNFVFRCFFSILYLACRRYGAQRCLISSGKFIFTKKVMIMILVMR